MKITRRQLRQIIKETISKTLNPINESAIPDQAAQDPEAHDWETYPNRTNILRKWICISGVPGGWGEEQWGFMKLQGDKVIRYGNPGGEIKTARIKELHAEGSTQKPFIGGAVLNKSFDSEDLQVNGMIRIGDELFVSGKVDVLGGWKGPDPGEYKRLDEPGADEVIRKIITDLYAKDSCTLELSRNGVTMVGDVDIIMVIGA